MQRMPHLYESFSAKEPCNYWLFSGKRPTAQGILCIFATLSQRRPGAALHLPSYSPKYRNERCIYIHTYVYTRTYIHIHTNVLYVNTYIYMYIADTCMRLLGRRFLPSCRIQVCVMHTCMQLLGRAVAHLTSPPTLRRTE